MPESIFPTLTSEALLPGHEVKDSDEEHESCPYAEAKAEVQDLSNIHVASKSNHKTGRYSSHKNTKGATEPHCKKMQSGIQW